MRCFIATFTVGLCLLVGNQAHACTLAPAYLDDEFGYDGIKLSDVSKQAHKIIIGQFVDSEGENSVSLIVRKKIKPQPRILKKKKIDTYFREVTVDKVHLYNGNKEQEFSSFSELKDFTRQFRAFPDSGGLRYGAGGPIAGIGHGSDCERFVMLLQDQNYLVYLDSKNLVMASFPIKSISSDFIDGAPTLFSAPPVSPEE